MFLVTHLNSDNNQHKGLETILKTLVREHYRE